MPEEVPIPHARQHLTQLEALSEQVAALKRKDPVGYVKENASKRLAAMTRPAFDIIPSDPTRPEVRQGTTPGDEHKHWFRAAEAQSESQHLLRSQVVFSNAHPLD